MLDPKSIPVVLIFALQAASAAEPPSKSHAHGHSHAERGKLTLDHGQKWQTDEPLRQGMERIRELSSSSAAAKQVSEGIDREIRTIFEKCRLAPEADAQLHVVLSRIMKASSELKRADSPKKRDGALTAVREALTQYGELFDHPGWETKRP